MHESGDVRKYDLLVIGTGDGGKVYAVAAAWAPDIDGLDLDRAGIERSPEGDFPLAA